MWFHISLYTTLLQICTYVGNGCFNGCVQRARRWPYDRGWRGNYLWRFFGLFVFQSFIQTAVDRVRFDLTARVIFFREYIFIRLALGASPLRLEVWQSPLEDYWYFQSPSPYEPSHLLSNIWNPRPHITVRFLLAALLL